MILYHVTPARNLESISYNGIDPGFTTREVRDVWLVRGSKVGWAIAHVAKRHDVLPSEVIVLRCHVPRSWLRRRKAGVWSTEQTIPLRIITDALDYTSIDDLSSERAN
jgi:hypothetical protein